MYKFVLIAFIFLIGSMFGWVLEVLYRRFVSNPNKNWVNPGFLAGPYLPLYGFSLCTVFILSHIDFTFIENTILRNVFLFFFMAVLVTIIEYIAGIIFIKGMNIKLWDYTNEWGNIKGIICPKYTFFWAILSALYYFFINPLIENSLKWLSLHLLFSFFIGFFYGVLALDFWYSMNVSSTIKKFAKENQIVVKYEDIKNYITMKNEERKERRKFILSFKSDNVSLIDNMKEYVEREKSRFAENINLFNQAKEMAKEYIEEKIKNDDSEK